MSLHDYWQMQNILTGIYALVVFFTPLRKSWLAISLVGISAFMGLIPV